MSKITSRNVLGSIIAQGNLTNGCIHIGSMTATDATGNYNYVGKSTNTRDDQNMKFGGRPDAVKMWIKFKGKGDVGNASVYLLTDGYYQDPEANTLTAKKIAHAKNGTIVSNDEYLHTTSLKTKETSNSFASSTIDIGLFISDYFSIVQSCASSRQL